MSPTRNSRIFRHNQQTETQWFKMLLISSAVISSVPYSLSLSLSKTKQGSFLKISNLAPTWQCRIGGKESQLQLGEHSRVQLCYRFGNEEEDGISCFNNFETPSPAKKRIISPASGSPELDAYLKFVERRYNRLHDEEEDISGFRMNWRWLNINTSTKSKGAEKKRHGTVMEVLGLSELASRCFLKKNKSKTSTTHPISVDRSIMFSQNLASKLSMINKLQTRYLTLLGIELRAALFNCIRCIGRDILNLTTMVKKLLISSTIQGGAKKVVNGVLLASIAIFAFFQPFLTKMTSA